jgi:hypothetical protein
MPREWSTSVRDCWNAPIHQILKAIDNHTRLYLKTGDPYHLEASANLRAYLRNLKDWIYNQEGKS